MTSRSGGKGARPYAIRLDAEGCGTMLGAVTWVMGALAILEDRGHASGDESFHELSEALLPGLERLVTELGGARIAAGRDDQRDAVVEASYQRVRGAFESWVQVTAADTIQVALTQRGEHRESGAE